MNGRTHRVRHGRSLPVAIHGNVDRDGQIVDLVDDLVGEVRRRRFDAQIGEHIAVDRGEQLRLIESAWLAHVGARP